MFMCRRPPIPDARYLRGADISAPTDVTSRTPTCRLLLPVFAISFLATLNSPSFLILRPIFYVPCFISNSFMFVCARFKVSPLSPKTCGYGARRHFSGRRKVAIELLFTAFAQCMCTAVFSSVSVLVSMASSSSSSSSSTSSSSPLSSSSPFPFRVFFCCKNIATIRASNIAHPCCSPKSGKGARGTSNAPKRTTTTRKNGDAHQRDNFPVYWGDDDDDDDEGEKTSRNCRASSPFLRLWRPSSSSRSPTRPRDVVIPTLFLLFLFLLFLPFQKKKSLGK